MMASIETDNLTERNDVYDILELFGHLEELDELASSNEDLMTAEEIEEDTLKEIWRRFQELIVDFLWNSGLGDSTNLVAFLLLVALLLLLLVVLLAIILVCRCLRRGRQSAKKKTNSRQNSTTRLISEEVNQLMKAGSDFTKIGDEVIKIENSFEAGRSWTLSRSRNWKSRQTKGSSNIGKRYEAESSPSSWQSWSLDSLEQRDQLPLGGHACVV